jgi:hypothetical protein
MPYADLATVQATDPGDPLSAAWCDQVRDNHEFFIDPPACSTFHTAAVSVPTSTFTVFNANSETFDNDSMHSTVSSTSRLTCQTPGRYLCFARHNWSANANGSRAMQYRINGVNPGSTAQQLMTVPAATAGVNTQVSSMWTLVLAAGDYVEIAGWQNTGGALNAVLEEFAAIFLTR